MQNNTVFPTKYQDQQISKTITRTFYGQEKLVNRLIKKIEAVKNELECKV